MKAVDLLKNYKIGVMKKYNFLVLAMLLLACLFFSNCIFYKTIEVSTSDPLIITSVESSKRDVLIQNKYSQALYRVYNFKMDDSTFSGDVLFTLGIHSPNTKTFLRKKQKEMKYDLFPSEVMHIYLKTDSMIKEGPFVMPLSDIEHIAYHKKAPGTSVLVSLSIPAVIIGTIAYFFSNIAFNSG